MKNSRIATAALIFLVALVGLALRLVDLPDRLLEEGGILVPGFDPYYHLRRVFLTIQQWPLVPLFDAEMNYPGGAMIIWPPLFDFTVATVALVAGCGDDIHCVEEVAGSLIPLIGVATILPLFFLARQTFGRDLALLSSLLLILSPVHIWYSRFGFVDHHTAVTFLSVALIWATSRAVRDDSSPWWSVAVGLVVAAGLLSWNGFLFYLAVVDFYLLILLVQERHAPSSRISLLVMGTHALACLLVAPFAYATIRAGGEPFFTLTLSWFQVSAVAAFGFVGLFAFLVKLPLFLRMSTLQRVLVIALLASVPLFFLGSQRSSIVEALTWMTTSDPFMSEVDESFPIFTERGLLDLGAPIRALTLLFYVLPFGLFLMGRQVLEEQGRDRAKLLVVVWGTALLLMTLLQRRFAEPLAPAQALIVGWLLIELGRKVVSASQVASVRLGALLLFVVAGAHFGPLRTVLAGDSALAAEREVAEFMARAKDRMDGRGEEPGAVLSPWLLGHRAHYLTGHPVVTNNFGSHIGLDSYMDGHRFFMAAEEKEAAAVLERRNVRYVVSDYNLGAAGNSIKVVGYDQSKYFVLAPAEGGVYSIHLLPPYMRTIFFRLAILEGTQRSFANNRGNEITIDGLGRFRLIADAQRDGEESNPKLFELVPGARLEVRTRPGELVRLRYRFTSDTGREHVYERSAVAGGEGRAAFVVGYPSDRPDLGFTSLYEIEVSGESFQLGVPDRAVSKAATVSLDAFAAGRVED